MLSTHLPRRRRGTTALAVAALVAALGVPALAAPATAVPEGADFTVEEVPGGGYRVVLDLAEPLPVRDAVPELAVDGTIIGPATESADGLTLTVETPDASVLGAEDVDVAWNGVLPDASAPSARRALPPSITDLPALLKRPVYQDPATPGPYAVERADYDLGDTATTLSGLSGLPVEVRSAVYVPKGAKGPRPVVVFLHGRHAACYNPTTRATNNTNWPCAEGFQPIQSHTGYAEPAQALASHGYVVVSVSANGINAKDATSTDDNGGLARGQLVMHHLDLLAKYNAKGSGSVLSGRLDLQNVGMMGHSRGGEGVVEAALLNAERAKPYGVRAVLPLAPVDFARATLPDVPMAVVLPYCDGDVSNQQGQHFYDDTRHSADDQVLRSSLMVMGANHNFFNTEWTPGVSVAPSGDDWSASADEVCGSAGSATRLTATEQRAVGTAYIAGFFRLVQGLERSFLPLFDGSEGTVPSTGRAVVYQQAQQPSLLRLDAATLEGPTSKVTTTGFDSAAYCASVALRAVPQYPACSATTLTSKVPHWTPATYATWVPTSPALRVQWGASAQPGEVRVAVGDRNVKLYDVLTFRTARDETATGDVDLTVTVTDAKGRSASTPVSAVSSALSPLPASSNTTNGRNLLGKTWMRTVQVPTSTFKGVDLTRVRTVSIASATPTGGAYLSDVAFERTGVLGGVGLPTALPQVSIVDTSVAEGDGAGTATVQLALSKKLPKAATINVQTAASGSAGAGQVPSTWIPVTLPKGATSATVQVPLVGDDEVDTAELRYKITLSAPVGAVVGDGFAWLTVTDDDAPL